ncbi:hypothetical protein [Gordonia sputi]|uniref:hypothetical protein n=1 Tax=Gordonia sputi TaxID=36823 RepID=UPI00030F8343|nr:hypothetical protein [Gordonia sputi]
MISTSSISGLGSISGGWLDQRWGAIGEWGQRDRRVISTSSISGGVSSIGGWGSIGGDLDKLDQRRGQLGRR